MKMELIDFENLYILEKARKARKEQKFFRLFDQLEGGSLVI